MTRKRAPGGGRKPLTTAEPTVKVAITLLPSQVEEMKQLGNGNLSQGIRKAIDTMTTINRRNEIISKIAERIYAAQWTDAQIEKQNSYGWTVDIRFRNAEYISDDEWSHFDDIHLDAGELAAAKRIAADLEATL